MIPNLFGPLTDLKKCKRCEILKPASNYYTSRGKPRSICKICYAEHNKSQREKHSDKRRAYDKARGTGWERSGREKYEITEREKHDAYLKRTYGITIGEYERMFHAQDKVCAICRDDCNRSTTDRLCVDHCHDSGRVRGLLCFQCNVGLGKFKDSVSHLKSAIKYLEIISA